MFELLDRIMIKMDNNYVPINAFLDLSKTFETTNYTILQTKLTYYGLNGSALHLFKSYLKNRNEIEKVNSDILATFFLGPLLLIIYNITIHKLVNYFQPT